MAPILEIRNVSKQFAGVRANDDISLTIEAGEVHALLGENGAGKSTLMNIVCGLYRPTSGGLCFAGKPVRFSSAKDAMGMGIGMVHQHFMLIPSFTVLENCLIGLRGDGVFLKKKAVCEKILALSEKFKMKIDPLAKVQSLSVGERQRVEIVKALLRGARLLILDEPTAVLTPQETHELFNMIREMKANGFTVLFISHKLNEAIQISDRVSILRLGTLVGTYPTADCSVDMLARCMVGREIDFTVTRAVQTGRDVCLLVEGLTLSGGPGEQNILTDISFQVHTGEVFGIAGVDGNGQTELIECLTGLRRANVGKALHKGKDLLFCSTREILSDGVSHIPQDRQNSGLALPMSISENFIMQDYYKKEFGRGAMLDKKFIRGRSEKLLTDFGIKAPGIWEPVQNLSGGNQQKVIVARELSRGAGLVIAMHPTRGLDVGAIEYIHGQIISQRDAGVAVLLVSTELDEVMKLADRMCVMFEGRIMGIVDSNKVSIEEIGLMMGGNPPRGTNSKGEEAC